MVALIEPGRVLAERYRLIRALGTGGMGTVWLARDELLDREVAVKEASPPADVSETEGAILRERTLREARTAARLNHRNVVTVYDVVEDDDRPWIVMELVAASSLRDIMLEDGPLMPRQAASIGLQVLAALRAAHALGIMHRDVKPGNVLIDAEGRAVLTDFGIARAQDSPTLTASGMIVGSPSYIAPERARGERGGPESDMWSLGATLYTAVEGRPPFDRSGALATLTAVVTDDPDPPSRSGPLWPVISGLLRRDPATRLGAAEAERMLRWIAEADDGPGTVPLLQPTASAEPDPADVSRARPAERLRRAERTRAFRPATAQPGLVQGPAEEPAQEEAAREELAREEVAPEEPAPEEPAPEELGWKDPAPAEPAPEEAAREEPAPGEAGRAEPAQEEAAQEEAAPEEAAPEEPATPRTGPGQDATATPPDGLPRWIPEPQSGPVREPVAESPPEFRDLRTSRRRRVIWAMAAVAALAVVAVTLLVLSSLKPNPAVRHQAGAPGRSDKSGTAAAGSHRPSSAPARRPSSSASTQPPSPTQSATPQPSPPSGPGGLAAVPAGFRRYHDPTGFSIAVPLGWNVSQRGTYVYVTPPSGARFLLIDQSNHPKPNPLADWRQQEANRIGTYPGYHRVRLQAISYPQAEKAADWEFTYYQNGVLTHVLNRNVLANSSHAYALYWSTPASQWSQSLYIFRVFARTFQPAQP